MTNLPRRFRARPVWTMRLAVPVLFVPAAPASADAIDQITGAELFEPIPSWEMWEGGSLPPQAQVTGQLFFDIFTVDQLTTVHAVEAAVSFKPSGATTLLNTNGAIVYLDGPNAFTPRAQWTNTSLPGAPNSGIIDDGVAPGIDLYRREFGTPFGLLPGTYAVAIYGFENDFIGTFAETDPWEFKVYQSSVGDDEGFVWPANGGPWYPPNIYDFEFGTYEIQYVNAAYRLVTTTIPAPTTAALLPLATLAVATRRRRTARQDR